MPAGPTISCGPAPHESWRSVPNKSPSGRHPSHRWVTRGSAVPQRPPTAWLPRTSTPPWAALVVRGCGKGYLIKKINPFKNPTDTYITAATTILNPCHNYYNYFLCFNNPGHESGIAFAWQVKGGSCGSFCWEPRLKPRFLDGVGKTLAFGNFPACGRLAR